MSWLIWVVFYPIIMSGAIRQIRERRRRGIKFEWSKGLATAGGCILVAVAGCASLIGFMAIDQPKIGCVLCVLVFGGGMTALIMAVNRHWPAEDGIRAP
jgi:hypothetical protein